MIVIQLFLKGNLTLSNKYSNSIGYRYDIPTDELGIPCLPLGDLTAEKFKELPSVRIGYAHPEGFLALLREADAIANTVEGSKDYIRSCFTEDRAGSDGGGRIRFLRAGQVFVASFRFSGAADMDAVKAVLSSITRIGETAEGITGEVKLRLFDSDEMAGKRNPFSKYCEYRALYYSAMVLSSVVMPAPYDEEVTTYRYIPGSMIRRQIRSAFQKTGENLICTNAYISREGKRLYPVPLCVSYVKLDKEQIRYRLSPGKDPDRVEQDVSFSNTFTDDFQKHLMRCVKPEIERIMTGDDNFCDALGRGQVFSGTIYGSDEEIRMIAKTINDHPFFSLGGSEEDGFGEVYVTVDRLCEEEAVTEHLSVSFDVVCLSDTLLLNDEGMPSVRAEDFLKVLEKKLGVSGRLETVGKYTDVYKDYKDYYGWNQAGPFVRCLKAGSVFRLSTKDGTAVDLAPVLHTFVGERIRDGYGEIMAYPAKNQYYRAARYENPEKYSKLMPLSIRNMQIGARMISTVVRKILENRVRSLARIDREEYLESMDSEPLVPVELLGLLKEIYDSGMEMEPMIEWYLDELKK